MFTKINSVYFKSTAVLMACAMLLMSFTMPGETVVLKAGTVIPLELTSTLSSKTARAGQIVSFRVTSDVKADNKTVIAAGTMAQGQVTHVKKSNLLGIQGELEVNIQSINAVDGSVVYLSGNGINDEGSNNMVISIVLTVLCLFGFLINGGNAEIPAGTQCNAMVMSNAEINL